VEPRDLTPEIVETFNLQTREGVLITGVLRDGPAARGGLKPGDIVTATRPQVASRESGEADATPEQDAEPD